MWKNKISLDKLEFNSENKLIPAIIQDNNTKEVLMLGYMNRDAVERTLATGMIHFFSRKRNRLWKKGETSGNYQFIKEAYYDCDADSLLFKVEQVGVTCHTGNKTCFFSTLTSYPNIWQELYEVIKERKKQAKTLSLNKEKKSYTAALFLAGKEELCKKLGEEAIELILAAKKKNKSEIVAETADLIFHLLVLLVGFGIKVEEVAEELYKRRRGTK